MGQEIERKFLVTGDGWRATARAIRITQGYLTRDKERVVRIRTANEAAFVTIKGATRGIARTEFEYPIPLADAVHMLRELCLTPLIVKTRYEVDAEELTWEIDVFEAPQPGLIIAELELPFADHPFARPDWLGAEVTGDPRFYNQNMLDGAATPS